MLRPPTLALAAAIALASCDDVRPPHGEELGTFAFEAVLEPTGEGRCDLPRSPGTLRFDALLSYEPMPLPDGSRRIWIQFLGQPGTPREGRLAGTTFTVRSPAEPDRVPRSLDSCRLDGNGDGVPDSNRCTLLFAEYIHGELLSHVPTGGCAPADLAACIDCPLPSPGEGQPLPPVGGICGDVTEDVALPEPSGAVCYCTGTGGTVAEARPCVLVYRLVGRPS